MVAVATAEEAFTAAAGFMVAEVVSTVAAGMAVRVSMAVAPASTVAARAFTSVARPITVDMVAVMSAASFRPLGGRAGGASTAAIDLT